MDRFEGETVNERAPIPPAQGPEAITPKRPRLWPVFLVVIFGMPVAAVTAGVIMLATAVAVDGWHVHLDRAYLRHIITLPSVVVASVVGLEVGLALVVVVPALFSPEPWYRRLGLVSFKGYGKPLLLFMLATFAINNILSVILPPLVGSPDNYLSPLVQTITGSTPVEQVILILTATIIAGFVEEIVFRGYIQRRFLERWPVWIAIVVASLIFAMAHMSLSYAAYIVPLGIWLGLVAWRTGSTWCSAACHLFNNMIAIVVLYAGTITGLDTPGVGKLEIGLALVAVPIVAWAIVVMFRLPVAGEATR